MQYKCLLIQFNDAVSIVDNLFVRIMKVGSARDERGQP